MFPTNSQGDVLDTIIYAADNGEQVTLFVKINDYAIPEVPVGMTCDLHAP